MHTLLLIPLLTTDRTSLKLTDERKRLFNQTSEIVAADGQNKPPRSNVIDTALTHLIESKGLVETLKR
ncbi:DUF7386 family protein [Halorubrum sp. DTA98]|uniref:DUF7386 family protein n=1 Tax=Halorubrum sp. DTA98 TaxID=3402163 RepID=UPI003AAB9C03